MQPQGVAILILSILLAVSISLTIVFAVQTSKCDQKQQRNVRGIFDDIGGFVTDHFVNPIGNALHLNETADLAQQVITQDNSGVLGAAATLSGVASNIQNPDRNFAGNQMAAVVQAVI
ncbi:MAG: hypothetical protein K0U52_05250 [Gammaproteobacteria bacterium]|nr:hypothetical protein [Gammaproteobacteria bacterium]